MTNMILGILNTVQTKPIDLQKNPASTNHFKEVINERITQVSRISKITALKPYDSKKEMPIEVSKNSRVRNAEVENPETTPDTDTDSYLLVHTQTVRQLMITKALDPPDPWVDQNKARKAYDLD